MDIKDQLKEIDRKLKKRMMYILLSGLLYSIGIAFLWVYYDWELPVFIMILLWANRIENKI